MIRTKTNIDNQVRQEWHLHYNLSKRLKRGSAERRVCDVCRFRWGFEIFKYDLVEKDSGEKTIFGEPRKSTEEFKFIERQIENRFVGGGDISSG